MNNNEPFLFYGGSILGPPSKKRGKPNQDAYGHTTTSAGSAVIAAADGAGSLPKSDVGAKIAVSTVLKEARQYDESKHPPHIILEDAVQKAREKLLAREDKNQLGCTLAVAMITDEDYAISITGDAFAIAYHQDETIELVDNPQDSEYANVTKLLTSVDPGIVTTYHEGSPKSIAVSSDGLTHFTIDNTKNGGVPTDGFWRPVFTKASDGSLDVQSLLRYMESLDKTDDDTTLLIATREEK